MSSRYYLIMTGIFILVSIAVYFVQQAFPSFSFPAMEGCAGLLYGLSIASYLLITAQIKKSPMAFTRGVMGATLLKLMVCMVAMLLFIVVNKETLYKPTVFVFFGIYIVFTASETLLLSKMAKTVS